METQDRETGTEASLPPLFHSYMLRDMTFGNRVVVTPMCQYRADDGHALSLIHI